MSSYNGGEWREGGFPPAPKNTTSPSSIDFSKVVAWSKMNVPSKGKSLCAGFVKLAWAWGGGCVYVSGNGYDNQKFCKQNGFVNVTFGINTPEDQFWNEPNPRGANGVLKWPQGYTQQPGDICLMKTKSSHHMVYAAGSGADEWVADFWQIGKDTQWETYKTQHNITCPFSNDNHTTPSGGLAVAGPYVYGGNYVKIQFWRHPNLTNVDRTNVPSANGSIGIGARQGITPFPGNTRTSWEPAEEQGSISFSQLNRLSGKKGVLLGAHLKQVQKKW